MPKPGPILLRDDATALAQKYSLALGQAVDFWTEAALFSQAGYAAIVLGPGDIKLAHTIDEWVTVSELEKTYHLYKKVIES